MEKEIVRKLRDANSNKVVCGGINTGKTGNVLFPLVDDMIEEKENLLIIDSKEEYYKTFYDELKKNKYNIIVINLRDAKKSNTWNPLEYPYSLYKNGYQDEAISQVNKIGKIIFKESGTSDPFWSDSATDFFVGVVLGLFQDAKESEINLNSVFSVFNADRKVSENYLLNKYFQLKDKTDPAYLSASGTAFAPKETRASILAVAKQKLKSYVLRYNLTNMLSKTDFEFEDLTSGKNAIFIITKDEDRDINQLASIFINSLYSLILKNKCKTKYNFVLDNFNTLFDVEGLTDMLSSCVYRKINFYLGVREYDSFISNYGAAIESLYTKIEMEVSSIKITTNHLSSKTIKGRNLLKKDLYFMENTNLPETVQHKYKIFDIEKFVINKYSDMVDKQLDNVTKGINKGIDKLNKGTNKVIDDLSINSLIEKIDKKIAELQKQEKDLKKDNKKDN